VRTDDRITLRDLRWSSVAAQIRRSQRLPTSRADLLGARLSDIRRGHEPRVIPPVEAIEALMQASLRFAAKGNVVSQRRADELGDQLRAPLAGAVANPAEPTALASRGFRHRQPQPFDLMVFG
jgi:hypothetical protein